MNIFSIWEEIPNKGSNIYLTCLFSSLFLSKDYLYFSVKVELK